MRRVLLVGAPVFFQRTAVRTSVALVISIFFLAIQIEYKPYGSAEHNWLAMMACIQITVTLSMILSHAVGLSISGGVGAVCILLNVIIVPLVIFFNTRRLKHRSEVFAALSLARDTEEKHGQKYNVGVPEGEQFLNPSYFKEAWKAGKKSERAVFTAALEWIDAALERPVSHQQWGKILFVLEQLPLTNSARGDPQYGTLHTATACSLHRCCSAVLMRFSFWNRSPVRYKKHVK